MKTRFLPAAALAAASPFAWAQSPCPDNTVRSLAPTVTVVASVPCGAGVAIDLGGVSIRVDEGLCPTSVIVTPARDIPDHRPGCGTLAAVDGQANVLELVFLCEKTHILVIPISSSCELKERKVVGALNNYRAVSCAGTRPTT